MSVTFEIPAPVGPPPATTTVGKTLAMSYGVYGRMPQRTGEDMILSLKKHVAEILDTYGGEFLRGLDADGNPAESDTWEVRLWDEEGTFRFPFARVSAVGPELSAGPPMHEQVTQPVTIHLYPYPAQDRERAELLGSRLQQLLKDTLRLGALRGRGLLVPLWDFGADPWEENGSGKLYRDSESRQPSDFVRVVDLTTERMSDPEDDRYTLAIINFRAQWDRVPREVPGHLVESVRVTAHPH